MSLRCIRCTERVHISCSTNGPPNLTLVDNPLVSQERRIEIRNMTSIYCIDSWFLLQVQSYVFHEEFEDTKWVIKIGKSKKDRQHNGQTKNIKRTNNDLQSIHIKLKIELCKPH